MKAYIFTVFVIALNSTAWAQDTAKVSIACKRCKQVQKLEKEFLDLKYEKSKDRAQGRKRFENVLAQLERFHQNKKSPTRREEFRALVLLVAAALPYDMETEGPASLLDLISRSSELNALYLETIAGMKDSCRQQFLKTVIEERACNAEVEKSGAPEEQAERCIRAFDYPKCAGLKLEE